MASKDADADWEFREADAAGKRFPTEYYSSAVHRGAQALPPFVARALQA